jgi:hypothetical protein
VSGPLLSHEQGASRGSGRLPVGGELRGVTVLAQPNGDVVLVVYGFNDDVPDTTVILSLERRTDANSFRHELSLKQTKRGQNFQIVVLTQPLNPANTAISCDTTDDATDQTDRAGYDTI